MGGIKMYLGVDYYPEHWNENMLNEALKELKLC